MTIVYRRGHANLVHKWLFPGVVYQSGLAKMVHKQCFLRFVYQMMCMKMVHKHRFSGIVYQISAKKKGTQTIFFAFVYQSYHFMSSFWNIWSLNLEERYLSIAPPAMQFPFLSREGP